MPAISNFARGNELFDTMIFVPNVIVPNVGASSTATANTTINGVLPGDFISWNWQGNVANLAIENFWVSAPNVVTSQWSNATLAAINATPPQPFLLEVIRPDVTATFGPPITFLPSVFQ
jgi:hypothetical protein